MSIFQKAKSRFKEMREEDHKKSQEHRNQRHYEKTVETMKRTELEAKRKSAFEEGYEKGTVERARHEGRQKAMQKRSFNLSVEGVLGGIGKGARYVGQVAENVSIGLTGESPRRSTRRKHKKTKKRSVRKKQPNDWLW